VDLCLDPELDSRIDPSADPSVDRDAVRPLDPDSHTTRFSRGITLREGITRLMREERVYQRDTGPAERKRGSR
jgi:hypothetical protein